jgi:DDE superfamily endonuclease
MPCRRRNSAALSRLPPHRRQMSPAPIVSCFFSRLRARLPAPIDDWIGKSEPGIAVSAGELDPGAVIRPAVGEWRRHFDREIVRWYLRFKLSLRDLVEMMAERGLSMAHTTIMRWVQRYAPEFEKRWRRFARAVGRSWRVDETYVKVRGEWRYLYRAVDRAGRTVEFRLSPKRDVAGRQGVLS